VEEESRDTRRSMSATAEKPSSRTYLLHAWAVGGNYKRWSSKRLRRKPVDNVAVVRHFFPETPDPTSLTPITFTHFEKT
jgi:hypothetical protein